MCFDNIFMAGNERSMNNFNIQRFLAGTRQTAIKKMNKRHKVSAQGTREGQWPGSVNRCGNGNENHGDIIVHLPTGEKEGEISNRRPAGTGGGQCFRFALGDLKTGSVFVKPWTTAARTETVDL